MMLQRAGLALICLATMATACTGRRTSYRLPPPPPCYVDGVYQVQAHRAASSGSVCNLNDLASLQGEVTLQRTGATTVWVHQRGQYGHQADLDPYACTVSTSRTPAHQRSVMGATVSGSAAYRINVRPNRTLDGNLQLFVQSNSYFVRPCTASFSIFGQQVR